MATFSGNNYVGEFDASRLIGQIKDGAHRGVGQAGAALQREYKIMLSKPGPSKGRIKGAIFKIKGALAKRLGKEQVIRSSEPGEPPRYRTRDLLNSIQSTFEGPALVRVGTHLLYGLWLELGTIKMKPRPWLRAGLVIMREELARIIIAAMKGGK